MKPNQPAYNRINRTDQTRRQKRRVFYCLIYPTLAKNLKFYRTQLGMTQVELAEKSGANRSYLASIESETQSNTSIKTVEKLAAALGVSLVDLLKPLAE